MVITRLRNWVFARVNGDEGIPVPGDLVGIDEFRRVYEHPAANGRSRGAALSDLFWYWLAPGPHVHQEHLEPGEQYRDVARTTRHVLARVPVEELAERCAARVLDGRRGLVRLRDLMMPIWAEFYYEVVFGTRCPREARDLIVANADDVVTALKCTGLRHMKRRARLTRYLLARLNDVPHHLPSSLSRIEQAWYLQGTFFNTAVVQSSEAMAHLLLVLAERPRDLDEAMDEAFRRFPLFGIAHRITSADVPLESGRTIPRGSVLCFNYPEYHRAGLEPIPFGVTGNRPCPARVHAPAAMRVVAREVLARYDLYSSATHTRPLPNRGPCVLVPRPGREPLALLVFMRVRDRWEDTWRGLVQLVLGSYMVWDARRVKLCQRHFGG
ncbi:cytochrome P450 [Lentzea tibetensis]|uniref:Cytochrome P450 n=1 Tax=Lentzea tibetensis TaxID=2591470 RepID=A0A563F0T7_9PSEU|nr:cytochrome P450 [Lentzea tibetensis]TWP52974.1 cytochrome P450 [Lentzea tibetensis]